MSCRTLSIARVQVLEWTAEPNINEKSKLNPRSRFVDFLYKTSCVQISGNIEKKKQS